MDQHEYSLVVYNVHKREEKGKEKRKEPRDIIDR